ncbi:hypothetical protein NOF04DRAFT_1317637 [Fusarium oxysporum II5]|uniref:Uncharacterized protein n=1 Tax=Fusarium oxysporum f. sp. cubense (strain race 4) TaxID=2502994 RepID=N1SBM2_FUSC4|nr:hypothetical protein FOC4_g10000800 [Fusarium odoratissimum]KAK2134295.1 hypothetical protein NOF04DRAFT_1317637 [Fusarium oxysporum II5]
MMTPNSPITESCQCPKAKEVDEREGEVGTSVICRDCLLEVATTQKPNVAEQTAVEQAVLPNGRAIYIAFKDSPWFSKASGECLNDYSIKTAILIWRKKNPSVRHLVREYGIAALVTSLKGLLDEEIFSSTDAARRRFLDLFSEEEVPRSEAGHGTMAELQSAKQGQADDGKCNPSDNTADGPGINRRQSTRLSRHHQKSDDLTFLPIRPRQRLMSQLQLILEHACFSFGQREMQKELDDWDWSCAEAVQLDTWIDLFKQNKTLENEENAGSLSNLFSSVARIQDIATHRLSVAVVEVNELLSSAEEFLQLLNIPIYRDAVKPLRQHIEEVLLTANRNVASVYKEVDRKSGEIEAQRERLKRQEEEVEWYRKENLNNIRDSIEHDIFAAMAKAKESLPDIGLADIR